jgi:hypothetical protein
MTTIQKTLVTAAVTVFAGAALYQAHQASRLRGELKISQQHQTEQGQQSEQERNADVTKRAALVEENERLKGSAADARKLREEVARLRADNQELTRLRGSNARPAGIAASPAAPSAVTELSKDSWADAGFATPQEALRTRGWSVLNGNRDRFKDSIVITDGARKILEDMFVQMAEASKDPNKAQLLQKVLEQKLGLEEGILMPMMAENQNKGYTGYRVLSQKSPSPDEAILEVETQMVSAPAKKENLKFRRLGNDWKVVIDEEFIQLPH